MQRRSSTKSTPPPFFFLLETWLVLTCSNWPNIGVCLSWNTLLSQRAGCVGVCVWVSGMGGSAVMTTYSAQETSLGSLQVISAIHTRQAGLNWPERSSTFPSLLLHESDRVLRLAACSENSSCGFFCFVFCTSLQRSLLLRSPATWTNPSRNLDQGAYVAFTQRVLWPPQHLQSRAT